MLDFVLANGRLIDGTGAPWRRCDVGVKDGKIVRIGKLVERKGNALFAHPAAKEIIDCADQYLTPGFIDIHSHSDVSIEENPQAESRIFQGITTELTGNCGMSCAPCSEEEAKRKDLRDYIGDLSYTWRTVGEFLSYLEKDVKPSVNQAFAVGHGSIRIGVMGFADRAPSEEELAAMKRLLGEALDDGAFCMTSGLIYPPGCYSKTEELIELAKVLQAKGSWYQTHMRNEGANIMEALKEAIRIAKEAGVPLQVSHHKVLGRDNWRSLCYKTTALIEKARAEGLDVQCDQYPYIATATSLGSNVPNACFEGGVEKMLERIEHEPDRQAIVRAMNQSHKGRWQDIYVSYAENEDLAWLVGKNMVEIAEQRGLDPASACLDILTATRGRAGEVQFSMAEEDVEYIMKKPYVMTGSDGNAFSLAYRGKPHPRAYGAFVRVISHYARDRKLFSIEEAVRKMTSMPAARMGLEDRGLIKEGYWADLVLLNLEKLEDTPTYKEPKQACRGIDRVYVNGVLTAQGGRHTGARCGKILRRAHLR